MIEALILYIVLCLALALTLAALAVAGTVRRRARTQLRDTLERRYIRILTHRLLAPQAPACRFPLIERASSRLLLAEVMAGFCSCTYGYPADRLEEVSERFGLDTMVARRARRSRGYRRAYYLHLLSQLPVAEPAMRRVAPLARDRHPYVRLYLLLARIGHTPGQCVRIIENHPDPLTPFALAEILMLLKRGVIPIACQPLIDSSNTNVKLLGMTIVRHFGIDEAEKAVSRAALHPDPLVRRAALHTLCALHKPLARLEVGYATSRMSEAQLRVFYRHLAAEGYSARSLAPLLAEHPDPAMNDYYQRLVGSYKRCLTAEPLLR